MILRQPSPRSMEANRHGPRGTSAGATPPIARRRSSPAITGSSRCARTATTKASCCGDFCSPMRFSTCPQTMRLGSRRSCASQSRSLLVAGRSPRSRTRCRYRLGSAAEPQRGTSGALPERTPRRDIGAPFRARLRAPRRSSPRRQRAVQRHRGDVDAYGGGDFGCLRGEEGA